MTTTSYIGLTHKFTARTHDSDIWLTSGANERLNIDCNGGIINNAVLGIGNTNVSNFLSTNITTTNILVTGNISAGSLVLTNLSVTNISTGTLTLSQFNTTSLTSTNLLTTNLTTTNITTTNLNTNTIVATSLTTTNLVATNITSTNLVTVYANGSSGTITNLNCTNATITNLNVTSIPAIISARTSFSSILTDGTFNFTNNGSTGSYVRILVSANLYLYHCWFYSAWSSKGSVASGSYVYLIPPSSMTYSGAGCITYDSAVTFYGFGGSSNCQIALDRYSSGFLYFSSFSQPQNVLTGSAFGASGSISGYFTYVGT